MSVFSSYDRRTQLAELTRPLWTNEGVLSSATQRARLLANMGITTDLTALTATAAEINQKADTTVQAVTTTAAGLTTGAILPTTNLAVITSASATDQAALPGIAANSLPVGHTIKGFVSANGCELITLASSNETINGVDSDGTNQLDVPAQATFIATVVTATGWSVMLTATATPDND